MTGAPLDPRTLERIRRNVAGLSIAGTNPDGWEISLVERERARLLAEVDRLAADLAAEQAKVQRARGWVVNAVDGAVVGFDAKQQMLDYLDGRPFPAALAGEGAASRKCPGGWIDAEHLTTCRAHDGRPQLRAAGEGAGCPCRLAAGQHYIGCPAGDPLVAGEGAAEPEGDR